jgi:hypothetical protein
LISLFFIFFFCELSFSFFLSTCCFLFRPWNL